MKLNNWTIYNYTIWRIQFRQLQMWNKQKLRVARSRRPDSTTSKCFICGRSCIRPTSGHVGSLNRACKLGNVITPLPKPKKFKQIQAQRKIMVTAFWHQSSVILYAFMKPRTTITSQLYCVTPPKLHHIIQNRLRRMLRSENVFLTPLKRFKENEELKISVQNW